MSAAEDLNTIGVARVSAMVDAVRGAGLATRLICSRTVYWGWLRIAQAYVCAHPYVAKPELPTMTPMSALTVVDSSFRHWGEQIPGTPQARR